MGAKVWKYYGGAARRAAHQIRVEDSPPEAIAARTDFDLFCDYVTGMASATHHRLWTPHLVTGQDSDSLKMLAGDDFNLLAPRGSAKSFRAACLAAFAIGHNPGIQILYLSNSATIALKQSRIVKRLIESPKYRQVFPHVIPGKRWSDTDWEIDKAFAGVSLIDSDKTFMAAGILSGIVGMRTHLTIFDDLIKSSQAIANPDIREKMQTTLREVVYPMQIPGGRRISIGTRFRRDDLHCTEFTEDNGWRSLSTSALVDEVSYWPERFETEFLLEEQRKDPVIFAYQYQNVLPPLDDDAIVKSQWIKYGEPPEKFRQLTLGVDLATSEKERGDYTVMLLAGRDYEGRYWLLDMIRFRVSGNIDKLDRVLELRSQWGRFEINVEAIQYQASFEGDYRRYIVGQRRVTDLTCIPVRLKGDKFERLEGVAPLFANDLVRLSSRVNWSTLVKELLLFGQCEHDDTADAMVYALAAIQRRERQQVWTY